MAARIPGANLAQRRSTLGTIADEKAADTYLEYKYLQALIAQFYVATATGAYLDRRAGEYGLYREAATTAAGTVIFSGTIEADIPPNTLLQNSDATITLATQADATLPAGGTVTVALAAITAGSAGNLAAGTVLNLVSAIPGVSATATVGTALTGGTDEELDPALRIRVLNRLRNPPQGGAAADYVAWAQLVPGVTRVWVLPANRGLGTCDVTFVMDGRANIIPLAADITAVQASIDANRPVTVDCTVFAPPAVPLAVTIQNLNPNTAPVQTAIGTALAALLTAQAGVAGGYAVSNQTGAVVQTTGTIFLDDIYDAIRQAGGVTSFDLVTPTADQTPASRSLLIYRAPTFE